MNCGCEAVVGRSGVPPLKKQKKLYLPNHTATMQDMANATPRTTDDTEEKKVEPSAPKPGFKPRFNIKMTQGEAPQTKEVEKVPESEKEAAEPTPSAETTAPKLAGFKPRFNMKTMVPKPAEAEEAKLGVVPEKEATEPAAEEEPADGVETTSPKPAGFKPRFNMKTMASKPAVDVAGKKEDIEQPESEAKPADIIEPLPPEETPAAPKIGFKPRFNAKTMKPKPPEE
jgi:hypothetical protein